MKSILVHLLSSLGRGLGVIAAITLLSGSAWAQISVGSGGSAIETFNTLPGVTNWATFGIGTDHQYTDEPSQDAAIQALNATDINLPIFPSTGNPPGTSRTCLWSSVGFYLCTRPTGNGAEMVMATLRNDTGHDLTTLSISYDLGQLLATIGTEIIPGHRLYYNLSGAANNWVVIGDYGTPGSQNPTVDLSATPWPAGSLLYLLFVDNNTGTNPDGAYTIDNFQVTLPGVPPSIIQQPAGVTNNEYSTVTLTVAASGSPPLTYQWFKNGTAIAGASTPTLWVTNTDGTGHTWSVPGDNGSYTVTVTGSANPPVTSSPALVRILADTNAPHFLWALATNDATGGAVIQVRLSESVDAIETEQLTWQVLKVSGPGGDLGSPDTISSNGNDIILTFSTVAIDPGTVYNVEYDGFAVHDLAQTPNTLTQNTVPLIAHQTEVLSMTATWKYDDTVLVDVPPTNWFFGNYDDSDTTIWKTGPGPFDSKRDANGTAGQHCRDNTLYGLGAVGTCINRTNSITGATNAVIFFRTHFTFSGTVSSNNVLLLNGKFDDGAVVYLNGAELERVGVPAGALSRTTFNTSRTVGDTDPQDVATLFPGSRLQAGDNVIAVELHQQSDTSSDLTMGLRVVAATITPQTGGPAGPTLQVTRNTTTGAITITWSGTGVLQQTSTVGPTASWSDVNGAGANSYTFTPAAGAGQLFFRTH